MCDLQFSKGKGSKVQHCLSFPAHFNKIVDIEFAADKIKYISIKRNKIYQSTHNVGSKWNGLFARFGILIKKNHTKNWKEILDEIRA